MCGIAGVWYEQPRRHENLSNSMEKMLSAMTHRGPDDGGYSVGENVAIGNRRLSIFDLSAAGKQPFFSADGRVWLVLNGEIYNHLEIRKEIEEEFDFHSNTDTEVLLHAYEKWGLECLQRLNGMFAFAIWDDRQRSLILCRDRIGIKPLYYFYDGTSFCFASEIKALLAGGISPSVNMAVLKDYLVDGFYDHTQNTFFKGIRQVSQGHYLVVNASGKREESFWRIEDKLLNKKDVREDAEEEYWHVLKDSVRLRMRADVPYAVMLSGGLDSSVIAHLADENISGQPLSVCTFRHVDQRYDEGPWADLVAQGRGWNRYDIMLTENHVADLLPLALWHQDEPFGSVATFADLLLAEKARANGIYILLEGQGADETLGGYEYYYAYYLADLAEKNIEKARDLHLEYSLLRGVEKSAVERSFLDILVRGKKVTGGIGQDGTVSVMEDVLSPGLLDWEGTGWELAIGQNTRLDATLYRDIARTKVPRVLRFKDKASMMFGVELRVPFLDHRLVELSFQISPERKLAHGYTKYCLREHMVGILPQETCFHVKRQIQTPQKDWLRGALRPIVEEAIYSDSFAQRGIFDVPKVQRVYKDYLEHPSRFQNLFFIWQWLQLEWWFRVFFDKSVQIKTSNQWADVTNHLRCPPKRV